jgi:transcriptional adapter 2-alpha
LPASSCSTKTSSTSTTTAKSSLNNFLRDNETTTSPDIDETNDYNEDDDGEDYEDEYDDNDNGGFEDLNEQQARVENDENRLNRTIISINSAKTSSEIVDNSVTSARPGGRDRTSAVTTAANNLYDKKLSRNINNIGSSSSYTKSKTSDNLSALNDKLNRTGGNNAYCNNNNASSTLALYSYFRPQSEIFTGDFNQRQSLHHEHSQLMVN